MIMSRRFLSLGSRFKAPIKPEERTPLTPTQQKLYPQKEQTFNEEGYPILKFLPSTKNYFEARKPLLRRDSEQRKQIGEPREQRMPENQDWPSIWPTARTFSPSAVPLPIKQGYTKKKSDAPKGKYANTELLKVANFLHLTPPAIERHCKALKEFCTEWPAGIDTDEEVSAHFPVTYVTRDFCHAAPTLRDPRSRVVILQFNIKNLNLTPEERDRMIELASHRYDKNTDIITIKADACPTKCQNEDYAGYLMTALYFESKNPDPETSLNQ